MQSQIFSSSYFSSESDDDGVVETERKRKVFKTRINNFEMWDEEEFIDRYRVSKEVALYITSLINEEIKTKTEKNLAVKPIDQVLVALQYYASGAFMRCVGDMAGLHKSTVCRIVHLVTTEIAKLRPLFIAMPSTEEEKKEVALKFYKIARFPKVLGAMDGTQVGIVSPGGSNAEDFRNRKGVFSVNVQVVGDADLKVRNIVARWPGSAHDSHVFNSSNLKSRLESGEFGQYWLLGDSGYALQPYVLTPLTNATTPGERLYNESQIRTRNTIERLFGVWKRRFPIVGSKIRCRLPEFQPIIVATAVLHNLCRIYNVRQPADNNVVLEDLNTEEVAVQPTSGVGVNVRQNLINTYFNRLL